MKQALIFPLGIILVVVIIFLANFAPNLWLSGWDNLHPEFDFGLNIKRSIFALWQEYQGLGLIGGMGHAADLPRQIILYFSSFIIPEHLLRQMYILIMLFLGPLGVYFLLDRIIIKNRIAAFGGSIFYLLNLATIQTFYTSYDPFVTQFGFLPLLFFSTFNYLNNPRLRNLLFLTVVNLLAIPQAYVQTVFLVYFAALLGSLLIFSMKKKLEVVKRSIKVLILTLFINAFWLLPFIYFVFNNASVTFQAKINQMTTENVFLLNKNFGDLTDVALLKGFWFDYRDFNHITHNFDDLLLPWRNHFNNIFVPVSGFLLFGVVLTGIIEAFRKKSEYRWILLFLFSVPFVILANNTPPFSWIDNLAYHSPFLSQSLRSPFTKFSILAAFSYSIFFAFGVHLILNFVKDKFKKALFCIFIGGLLILLTWPIFRGNLFYRQLKVNIPQDYHKLWDFFKHQNPNTRIANFPVDNFWGWNFYKWGYSGSGFLWYGLNQPILDRAFDVWSQTGENYYWEISFALYSKNKDLFEKVLDKYQVSYLLVDENVLYPSSPRALFFDELEKMISQSSNLNLDQQFGNIKVYKHQIKAPIQNFVFLAENLPNIEPEYKWGNFDKAYLENGDYISIPSSNLQSPASSYYPFRSFFTGKNQENLEFQVEDKGDYFLFKKEIPSSFKNYFVEVPDIKDIKLLWVDPNDLAKTKAILGDIYFNGNIFEVKVPKVGGLFSANLDGSNQNQFWLKDLPNDIGYLITVESINLQGKPMNFWIENSNLRKADLETYLPASRDKPAKTSTSFFIQPPMEKDGLGYTLHFDQIYLGEEKPKNQLGKIQVYPIPFDFLTGLKLKKNNIFRQSNLIAVSVEHPNPSFYLVSMSNQNNFIGENSALVLSQSYDKGWRAFIVRNSESRVQSILNMAFPFFFGKELKDHVLVNNWENGWSLNSQLLIPNSKLVIVYLPQYLEFVGMFYLAAWIVYMFLLYIYKKTNLTRQV